MQTIRWPLMKNAITWSDRFHLAKFILTSDRYTNGPKVREFEAQWADWVGTRHALMVSSGSTANLLLVSAIKEKYNLKNGDKCLVPACTWVTNISPVIQLGLTPIFCDINLSDFSFDKNHLAEIQKQHPDIKLIFVTHLIGFSADNEYLRELFPSAIIMDDVCESHGCKGPDGTRRGSTEAGGTFSFYFGHHITTIEGGMVNTNDSDLYELMRMKRSHGMARESGNAKKYTDQYPDINPQFLFVTDGYNFRSTELNAVLGMCQLKRLDSYIQIRRKNFADFLQVLEKHLDKFFPIGWQEANSNYAFPFLCRTKGILNSLKKLFDENGIEHRPIISGNLLRQPFLKNYNFGVTKNSYNVDFVNDNGLFIGNNHFISRSDIEWLDKILGKLDV